MPLGCTHELHDLARAGRAWLTNAALPLWHSAGFNAEASCFEEQLSFERKPVATAPQRLMVQARQVAVFSRMALEGYYPLGRDAAIAAGRAMIERYHRADGAPGWVFSLDRAHEVVDTTRDLYAHAFVIFALAWLSRIDDSPVIATALADTLSFLNGSFSDQLNGGYWDTLPRKDDLRRQNPHMHLFEAYIELYHARPCPEVLELCHRIDNLARSHFLAPASGMLREVFHEDWRVHPADGHGSLEPGHQFEWAWLWRRYECMTRQNRDAIVTRLVNGALVGGVDERTGRIVDELGEDGVVRKATSRAWPYAEACKALAREIELGRVELLPIYCSIYRRMLALYCRPDLNGGWIDHLGTGDQPLSTVMPASSLYHLSYGITSIDSLLMTA